jgi:hypothetical protein
MSGGRTIELPTCASSQAKYSKEEEKVQVKIIGIGRITRVSSDSLVILIVRRFFGLFIFRF